MKSKFKSPTAIALLFFVFGMLALASCSKDDEPSGDDKDPVEDNGGSTGNTSGTLIGSWKCIWDFDRQPLGDQIFTFGKDGKLTMTMTYLGQTQTYTTTFTYNSYTFTYSDEGTPDTIYYRIVNGRLFTYEDSDGDDYRLDADGNYPYKRIYVRI